MQALVGQDLAGVLPGESVLARRRAGETEVDGRRQVGSDGRRRAAPRFHSSAIRVRPSTPRNFTVCSSLLPVLTDVLSADPGAHVTQTKFAPIFGPGWTRSVPTICDRAARHRQMATTAGIIDAAYGCLSEPHSGPIPVAAILAARRAVHPGVLPPLRVEGRAVPGDAAAGEPMRWPIGWTASPRITRRSGRPAHGVDRRDVRPDYDDRSCECISP